MQNKLFLKAADICELLEVKQTSAFVFICSGLPVLGSEIAPSCSV